MGSNISDPMERLIAGGLEAGSFRYSHEGDRDAVGQTLDFHLRDLDIYIEVKRFHSPRIADQMSRADNVIVAQGKQAVELLAQLLARRPRIGDDAIDRARKAITDRYYAGGKVVQITSVKPRELVELVVNALVATEGKA